MKFFRSVFLISALLLTAETLFSADPARIAVADLAKIFRGYYKTAAAESVLREQTRVSLEYRNKLLAKHKSMEDELKVLADRTKNLAISEQDRVAFAAQAEEKAKQIRAMRSQIDLYNREKTAELRKIELEKRAAILEEIRAEISRQAQTRKYRYVIDSSARSADGTPVLLMHPPGDDLTEGVLRALNRGHEK